MKRVKVGALFSLLVFGLSLWASSTLSARDQSLLSADELREFFYDNRVFGIPFGQLEEQEARLGAEHLIYRHSREALKKLLIDEAIEKVESEELEVPSHLWISEVPGASLKEPWVLSALFFVDLSLDHGTSLLEEVAEGILSRWEAWYPRHSLLHPELVQGALLLFALGIESEEKLKEVFGPFRERYEQFFQGARLALNVLLEAPNEPKSVFAFWPWLWSEEEALSEISLEREWFLRAQKDVRMEEENWVASLLEAWSPEDLPYRSRALAELIGKNLLKGRWRSAREVVKALPVYHDKEQLRQIRLKRVDVIPFVDRLRLEMLSQIVPAESIQEKEARRKAELEQRFLIPLEESVRARHGRIPPRSRAEMLLSNLRQDFAQRENFPFPSARLPRGPWVVDFLNSWVHSPVWGGEDQRDPALLQSLEARLSKLGNKRGTQHCLNFLIWLGQKDSSF